jgi:hypothetical protein
MECEFCKKILKTKYSLISHQKTVKNCLLLQGKEEDEETLKYNCSFCNKKFSRYYHLERHEYDCKIKKQEEEKNILKKLEEYKLLKDENKKLKLEIKQQRQYEKEIEVLKKEILEKDLELERLRTEIRVKDELKENVEKIIEKNNNDKLTMFKDAVQSQALANKGSRTTNNNTTNTINNIYIKQQIDKLTPINELPNLIATNPMLSSTLRNLNSLDDFYYLCANTTKKCFLVKDSSREIVSGRKVDENNNVEYVSGKMQSLIGDYIVNEDLSKKLNDEYKIFLEKITSNPDEEMDQDDIILGNQLLLLCNKITKANKNKNKLLDEELLNSISKKAMTIIPKIKNKEGPGPGNPEFSSGSDGLSKEEPENLRILYEGRDPKIDINDSNSISQGSLTGRDDTVTLTV